MVEINNFSLDHAIKLHRLRLEDNLNDKGLLSFVQGVVNGHGEFIVKVHL